MRADESAGEPFNEPPPYFPTEDDTNPRQSLCKKYKSSELPGDQMTTQISAKKHRRIKALIHKELAKHTGDTSENAVHLIQDVSRDGEDLLYIFAVSDAFSPHIPHLSISEIMDVTIDYLNDNNIPHMPISYEIAKEEWPAFKQGFIHAIPDTD